MYRDSSGQLIYSPSDLIRFMESPFASFMERRYLETPELDTPDEADEELALIADSGTEHEEKFLQRLKASGRDVCEITRGRDAASQTQQAIKAGREVIFQGYLTHGSFRGYTDFLVRTDEGTYEVWDTKLSRKVKPYFLIQLCCYAEMLASQQGTIPEHVTVVLGDNKSQKFRTSDYFYYYRQLKAAFQEHMDAFSLDAEPPVPDPRAHHGRWESHAQDWLMKRDHLVQVAGITAGQIGKLTAAGIETLAELAETTMSRIPKMTPDTFEKLTNQARVQLATRRLEEASDTPEQTRPVWELLPPNPHNERAGLATLPPVSPGDVYFDIEGYPLFEHGLEYLLGATVIDNGTLEFHDWWAHDHPQEKASFEAFIDWAYQRWCDDPAMHIYHYAPYEVTAMGRLMGRYATREDEVDTLLRNNVFVDLYRVVKQSLLIGGPNYSLKTVEQLYQDRREGDVQTAAASMVYYANWIESEEPQDWQSSGLLREIRDYNKVDCDSTLELAQWLRGLQSEHGIKWIPDYRDEEGTRTVTPSPQIASPLKDEDIARQSLAAELLKQIPADRDARDQQHERWLIQEFLAYLVEFHRREAKPVWWAWFDRHEKTTDELFDDIDCLAGLKRTNRSPEQVKQSLAFEYSFDPSQETKISDRSTVGLHTTPEIKTRTTVFEFDRSGTVKLKFGNQALGRMEDGEPPQTLSLIPYEYVDAGKIADAIHRVAENWIQENKIPEAIRRFLLRLPPRIAGTDEGQPLLRDGEEIVEGCIRIVKNMQDSTLCIQGPPGAGKTYTASHMIHALLADGKRVGITSNSHSAIMNVMRACFDEGGDRFPAIKAGGDENEPLYEQWEELQYVKNGSKAAADYEQGLIGGTAWLFANPLMEEKLDYLFVDEAGQVSIANLVGMSRATNNIVLIGDQMQLGQPTGGSHPGETGASLLEYLLGQHAVVPDDLGVFLKESWRMHPEVCDFISRTIYQGRLSNHSSTVNRTIKYDPATASRIQSEAGIVFVPVQHSGNTQSSDEEVEVIAGITQELLGRTHHDRDGRMIGPVGIQDILYVAPYNMQVKRLREQLPDGARVGSVDKFQGQEAPIVVVSLCSSAGDFGQRGVDFVLNRNRLNVAISRAKSLAIVVGDPEIAHANVSSVKEIEAINLFCRIVDNSSQ